MPLHASPWHSMPLHGIMDFMAVHALHCIQCIPIHISEVMATHIIVTHIYLGSNMLNMNVLCQVTLGGYQTVIYRSYITISLVYNPLKSRNVNRT